MMHEEEEQHESKSAALLPRASFPFNKKKQHCTSVSAVDFMNASESVSCPWQLLACLSVAVQMGVVATLSPHPCRVCGAVRLHASLQPVTSGTTVT